MQLKIVYSNMRYIHNIIHKHIYIYYVKNTNVNHVFLILYIV